MSHSVGMLTGSPKKTGLGGWKRVSARTIVLGSMDKVQKLLAKGGVKSSQKALWRGRG